MNSEFDYAFENMRLHHLLHQLHPNEEVTGKVIFGCDENENTHGYSSWFFNDDINSQLSESGFKMMLIHLIDALIEYRRSFFHHGFREGVISINGSKIRIEWLDDGEARTCIDRLNAELIN